MIPIDFLASIFLATDLALDLPLLEVEFANGLISKL